MTSPRRHTVTLQKRLRFRFGLLVSCAITLVVTGFLFFGLRPMIDRVVANRFSMAAARVEASLDRVFEPAEQFLNTSSMWLASADINTKDPQIFNQYFRPVLEALPQATSVVAGTASGKGWMLLQQPNGAWLNRLTDLRRMGNQHLFFEWRANGSVNKYKKSFEYDPRTRDWYRVAIENTSSVQWTVPYMFLTTGEPGITASKHVLAKGGHDLVVGLDLKLRDLSATTMNANMGGHGKALVLTEDLRVLALPAPPSGISNVDWVAKILEPVSDLGLQQLDDALPFLSAGKRAEKINYRSQGENWFASVHSYPLGKQRLLIVTLAPESDFAPDWFSITGSLAAGLVLMLLLAAFFARQQARNISRPLERLAADSERIGRLDFHGEEVGQSDITEIAQLANAQKTMRDMLQLNQEQIVRKEEELNRQIEALRIAEEKISESEAYNKVLFLDSNIALLVLDPDNGHCVDCNNAAARIFQLPGREAVLGLGVLDVSTSAQYDGTASMEAARSKAKDALNHGAQIFEWRHRHPDGTEWDAEVHLMPFRHDGRLLLQVSLQDITERKRSAIALENLALYDTLTGLPNRAQFLSRLRQDIQTAPKHAGSLSVLFLDLDRFKEINDTQGHGVGDDVLCEVAQQFRAVLRGEEMLARIGGDEFAIVATNTERITASIIAERLLAALRLPLRIGNSQFTLGVSIGIAIFNEDGVSPETLLRYADIAMYRAKSLGRGYMFYEPEMSSDLAQRLMLARDLKQALNTAQGGLTLHFQPQFDLRTGGIVGAEALLRWQHAELGSISPTEFMPVAEERGMALMIGNWVLEEACRQCKAWQDSGMLFPGRMAINLSAREIEDVGFPERAGRMVSAYGLSPRQFEFELTESGMMRNVDQAIESLERLKVSGFTLAIDDFGTGYSSLAYLQRLPASKLKIDMSFVRDMIENASDNAIVDTIIGMGRTLGLRTIAEGVETQEQADALTAMGCDEAQGFLLGCPEPAIVFEQRWIRDGSNSQPPAAT